MIMAANLQESLPTIGLNPTTVQHLQRLVLLNNESRDAYQFAASPATDSQFIALAEQAVLIHQAQASTLQNILWCNGSASRSHDHFETYCVRRIYKVLNESQEHVDTCLVDSLLEINEYVCSCYQDIRNTIQGRGIRQLLAEQAFQIQQLRKNMLDLRQEIAINSSAKGN